MEANTGERATQWTDDSLLDELRQLGDSLADECFTELKETLEKHDFSDLFGTLSSNVQPLPDTAPDCLKTFFERSTRLPLVGGKTVDRERLAAGAKTFMSHALPAALVLLSKSLPEGYAAPNLSRILCLSDNLTKRPYRRLLGVLQMIINVCAAGGFEPSGKAIITIPKIRLLHAGVRHIAREHLPEYQHEYGVPVNLEDMLGTVMGFSYLLISGLKKLEIGLTDKDAEDLYYLWRVFAQMMGIHPKGEPNSSTYVPADLQAAATFYDSYRRRHYVPAARNPDGVKLAEANLQMLNDLLPHTPLRRLGLKIVPRVYMEELIGQPGCALIGIRRVRFLPVTKWLLKHLPVIWVRLWDISERLDSSGDIHQNLSRIFFQHLIRQDYDGEITFLIPDTLTELKKLA